ncbi:hypothetical protein R1sor_001048 [Riccia sorocarpa]|uniref:Uncharacterized protein n=1 Tax=Riccia sorocarpa TaxID=122646 RepID=A0ABD3GWU3_9MARC
MASSLALGSSFLTGSGASLKHGTAEWHHYRHHQSYESPEQSGGLITCKGSTSYSGSSLKENQQHELKSSIPEAEAAAAFQMLERSSPKKNWWDPIFSFSSEGIWSTILPEGTEGAAAVVDHSSVVRPSGPPVMGGSTTERSPSISLQELIASSSTKQIPPPAAAAIAMTCIQQQQREIQSTSLGSSPQKPSEVVRVSSSVSRTMKQVIFDDTKARELRKQIRKQQTWHEAWVHSSIASQLAVPKGLRFVVEVPKYLGNVLYYQNGLSVVERFDSTSWGVGY